MQNEFATHYDRQTESLSPAPEGSVTSASQTTDSPRRNGFRDGNEEKQDRLREAASPSKPARKRRPEPTYVCSRDYAPLPEEAPSDGQRESWDKRSDRLERKSKVRSRVRRGPRRCASD